jgi:hypothetical protein
VRDEGFIGRSQSAYGHAEHWELVLGWLDAYIKLRSQTKSEIMLWDNYHGGKK